MMENGYWMLFGELNLDRDTRRLNHNFLNLTYALPDKRFLSIQRPLMTYKNVYKRALLQTVKSHYSTINSYIIQIKFQF